MSGATARSVGLGEDGFATLDSRGPDDAPALIVVPPLGIPGAVLDPFRDRLARSLRVHTVELPGTGHASAIRAGATTRDLASALRGVVERTDLEGAHLIGISLGGMIAQWAAIDGRGCFGHIVLASTAAHGLRAALAGAPAKLALARCLIGPDDAGFQLARGVVSDHVRADAPEMDRIERAIADSPRDATDLAWLAAAAVRHDARAELAAIRGPVLVVTGDHDEIIPRSLQEDLARAIGAEQVIIRGAGHDVASDQPSLTADAVVEFLLR